MTNSPFSPHLPDERGARSRDRVLLYTRGMGLAPLESLEMALESLRRSGEYADNAKAMQALRTLIQERGLAHGLLDDKGERLLCAPPMNRHPMIAEALDRKPWLSALKRLFKKGHKKNGPAPCDRAGHAFTQNDTHTVSHNPGEHKKDASGEDQDH